MAKTTDLSTEKARAESALDAVRDLSNIKASEVPTFDDIASYFDKLADASDYGDGWEEARGDVKMQLCGKPFVIFDYHILASTLPEDDHQGLYRASEYDGVVFRVITKDNAHYRVFDWGVGLLPWFETLAAEGVRGGVLCKKGLRVSQYEGPDGPAETYYMDTAS